MKYVCLGYIDEKKWEALSEQERNTLMDQCFAYDDILRKNGHFVGGIGLQSIRNAATLQWRNGKVSFSDGPFAETKEHLGGILILEARDLNHAVQLMSQHPGVKVGPFEIRPAEELEGLIAESETRRATIAADGKAKVTKEGLVLQKITPCLWFDGQAEEAVQFYTSIFKESRIGKISRYGKEGFEIHGKAEGTVMVIEFELAGRTFTALNGGPDFQFNEAVSFQVLCDTQAEVDEYWEKLGAGGDPHAQQCGWLKDRYGVSWQIVPKALGEYMSDPDQARTERVMKALLQMKKIDLETLRRAYDGQTGA